MPLLKHIGQRKILLDTHVWLWTMTESSILEKRFSHIFEKALETGSILISALSIWEIGMLVDKKRIELELDVLDWINLALDEPGIRLCPITPSIAIQSTRLPGEVHEDPVDRLLIATAHEENAVLVTCDKKIVDYGMGKFIAVFDPSK
jgi:PIN domain nuclease of toxin-antitoxin system